MSYLECPGCGQKVLSIATRCPNCGRAADPKPFHYSAPRSKNWGVPIGLLVAALTLGGSVVVVDRLRRRLETRPLPPTPVETVVPSPAVDTVPAAVPDSTVDSLPAGDPVPSPTPALTPVTAPQTVPPPPPPPPPAPAPVVPPAAVARAMAPAAAPVVAGDGVRRRVDRWVNMRAERSPSAPVLQVLGAGQEVLTDSLSRGWYRVRAGDGTIGYVDRRFFSDSTP